MRIYIIILISVLCVVGISAQNSADSVRSDIVLRTYVEAEEVPLNREVVYHVELRWKGDLNRYQISKLNEPQLTNLVLRGSGSSNRDTGTMAIKQFTFYLRPLEMGMAYIDGAKLTYTDTGTNTESSLLSSRIGVKIKEPLPEPGDSDLFSVLMYVFIGILAIATAFLFIYRYQTRKNAELEKLQHENLETIEEKYLRLLKETIHLKKENIKDCMADLVHLIVGYLGEQFNLPAGNLTSKDMIDLLKDKDLGTEHLERLEDFLIRADLIKFAGEPVTESDFHRYYDTIELILENQRIKRLKEEDK